MESSKYNHNNDWRNKKKDNFRHFNHNQFGGSKPRSYGNRRSSFGCQLSSWDKKFCATAGVPWQKVLETQKYLCHDEKVLQWNDTAVKEAFWNAKKRFWAEMQGQPCDVKLPDPDIYIDKIDWESSNVDLDLMLDLEKRDPDIYYESEKQNGGVVVGIPVVQEQYVISPTGWGDDTEEWDSQPKNGERHNSNGYDHWDDNDASRVGKDCSRGWDDGNGFAAKTRADNGPTTNGNTQQWDRAYNKNLFDHRDASWNTSRYKVNRFHHYNHNQSMLNDYGDKRGNFAHRNPLIEWRPVTRQW